jgi:catechol 2,3-dioxygenase-like lactoylglutathione lyase family enzyme
MERIIDRLVRDFECGRLSRRQLIQSLTLAASAASTAAAADTAPFKAVTVNHISYQVADYAKTRDFYTGLLGMQASHDDGRQCYLSFGNTFLLPRNVRQGRTAPLVDHIAYTIETWNKDGVEAELKKRGLPIRPDTENSFHTKDPDGFDVQISGKEMKA